MTTDRHTSLATAIVVGTGVFWGFYWLPVRTLTVLGLAGAWGTVAITLAAVLLLIPFAITHRRQIASAGPVALASIALGGAAFALYSIGFVYGRVAIIILLWFLTPVWSTLIARFIMGWPTPRLRIVAIAVGIVGLFIMLGADGELPLPHGIGEWMALVAGLLWSVATTGIRAKSTLAPLPAAFVFALGALVASVALAPALSPPPDTLNAPLLATAVALATGGLWWALSIASLMWATVRLDPTRVGILLMTEVLFGAASAALLAGELLDRPELIGGALVLVAGILEVWPVKGRRTDSRP